MRKLLSVLLIFAVCNIISSSSAITAANSKQDSRKEKVKVIWVSGIVTNEQGKCLKGVLVMCEKKSESDILFGVETGDDGKFKIRNKSDCTLIFSLEGYKSQKININGKDEIDVVMKKLKPNLTN